MRGTQERIQLPREATHVYRKPAAQWDRCSLPAPGVSVSQEDRRLRCSPCSTVCAVWDTQEGPGMVNSLGWHFSHAGMAVIERGVVCDDTDRLEAVPLTF